MSPFGLAVLLLLIVAATSALSGVIGMAGGLLLMATLTFLLPIPLAMAFHGIVQFTANGSRAWFLRAHIQWEILPLYCAGAVLTVIAFGIFAVVADANVVLILIGLFPWLALALRDKVNLDITQGPITFLAGIAITAAQLLAGASGPLLDVFYQRSTLPRHAIVASKAITQTIGHFGKMVYYVHFAVQMGLDDHPLLSWWYQMICIVIVLLCTSMGTRLLDRLSEPSFRRITNFVILGLGLASAATGTYRLFDA